MTNENGSENNSSTLILVGDVMLGGEFPVFKNENNLDWSYPFLKLQPLFSNADIVFANLECPLSDEGPPRADKEMALHAPPDSLKAFRHLNCSVVSIGNNHINDYGEQGLSKTIELLKTNEIPYFGAGSNLQEASKEVVLDKNGLKISFLGYTTDDMHVRSIIAGPNTAGCAPYDFARIRDDINKIRNESDVICISLHWGYELHRFPAPEQIDLAHRIIDAGADIIIGHHPHVIQGFEKYRHGIIFYSLGNFFFSSYWDKCGVVKGKKKETKRFMIAECQISRGKVELLRVWPGSMNQDYQLVLFEGRKRKKVDIEIDLLSREIERSDYEAFWKTYKGEFSKEREHSTVEALPARIRELGISGCIAAIQEKGVKGNLQVLITMMRVLFWRIKKVSRR